MEDNPVWQELRKAFLEARENGETLSRVLKRQQKTGETKPTPPPSRPSQTPLPLPSFPSPLFLRWIVENL